MPKFMVIPRDEPDQFAEYSPEDMQRLVERYHAWGRRLAEEGRMVLGHKLRDGAGAVIRNGSGGPSVTDGPYVETKEVIGGFWIIQAGDLAEATDVVSDCPHLEHDRGSLEIREIEGDD
ncbi:MAG: YciI family protein [Longimicrobiales bacterium]